MHSFLRSIGFSKLKKKKEIRDLMQEIIENPDKKITSEDAEGNVFVELSKEYGDDIGIAVRGEYMDDETFEPEYFYPYFHGTGITTYAKVEVEKHTDKESYAGVCDEFKIGVALIFYLQNVIEYLNNGKNKKLQMLNTSTTLSALSNSGKILLPIQKIDEKSQGRTSTERGRLIAAAREGDEEAIESLTLEDIDIYAMISSRILDEDVLSIVNSYFMPHGVECDLYSILGEIKQVSYIRNKKTHEKIYILTIDCNDMIFDVCINSVDLIGEPEIRRRFKGVIWMQGSINYEN